MALRYAVIGSGQIGMGYDYACPDDSRILTHATAGLYHPDFDLVGAVDVSANKRAQFTDKFNLPAFETVGELYKATAVDVLALSVPTNTLSSAFETLLQHQPQFILCEKPIAYDYRSAKTMIANAQKLSIPVGVNYVRRFEPGILTLKQMISSGETGEIYKVVVFYSKGIINNGSHFINLLQYLLGDYSECRVIAPGRTMGHDCEPDVHLKMGGVDVYFLAAREENFSYTDIKLITDKGVIEYNGADRLAFYPLIEDPLYPGYTILHPEPNLIPVQMERSQYHVLQGVSDYLLRSAPFASSGASALKTNQVIHDIVSSRNPSQEE